jgi:hypothetical protein
MKRTIFSELAIDTIFFWGSYYEKDMNWGCKRTSRTADWSPRILGKVSALVTRGYFGKNEIVYISSH